MNQSNRLRLGVITLWLMMVSHPTQAQDSLATLINERLAHMKSVAAYKWIHGLRVEDLDREAAVIEAATQAGLNHRIKVSSSEKFFQAQIIAAKEIQHHWHKQWKIGNAPTTAPDLTAQIRPKLIELGNQISSQLTSSNPIALGTVTATGLTGATADNIANAANNIEQYSNTLEQILDSGVIRVGTTFDYAPFSSQVVDNDTFIPSGIDTDLARDLAASLDAEVIFVTTSWPTLMEDFSAGLFDIGMSGISINLQRQQQAFFSDPYHSGGKTPIARCNMSDSFTSLEKIDQSKTRVIVNPGGTNEKFIRAHIKHAQVILHQDNRTIFEEIVDGNADVMITDAVEVLVQANVQKELCATMPGQTLTFQQKGYLLPQDSIWKNYIDAWLNQRQGDGTVARLFKHHHANHQQTN